MIQLAPRTSSYVWRRNLPVKADVAGVELERLQEEHGELTPLIVVESARVDTSPIHGLFTWDDSRAAELHRHNEARYILRNLRIEYRKAESADNGSGGILLIPAFPNVEIGEKDDDEEEVPTMRRVYMTAWSAFENPQARAYILRTAKDELEAWRRKYANLREFDHLVKEIDRTMKTLTTEIKA